MSISDKIENILEDIINSKYILPILEKFLDNLVKILEYIGIDCSGTTEEDEFNKMYTAHTVLGLLLINIESIPSEEEYGKFSNKCEDLEFIELFNYAKKRTGDLFTIEEFMELDNDKLKEINKEDKEWIKISY